MRIRKDGKVVLSILLVALGVGILGIGVASSGSTSAPGILLPRVNTVTLPQSEFPVAIQQATFHSDPVTREVTLQYIISNHENEEIEQVRFLLLVLNTDGPARAGQMVNEHIHLGVGKTVHGTLRVSNQLYLDPQEFISHKMVAALVGARGAYHSWEVSLSSELMVLMRTGGSLLSGQVTRSLVSAQDSFDSASDPDPPGGPCDLTCTNCAVLAREFCTGGVKTFSCNTATCGCTFECFAGEDGDGEVRKPK